ncbi:MAG: hypothetical protein WCE64_07315 [Bacteroidales bacterium]
MTHFRIRAVLLITLIGCNSEDSPTIPLIPNVNTYPYCIVNQTSAILFGALNPDEKSDMTEYGFCWSTNENPSLTDNKTIANVSNRTFSTTITNLDPNTKYYVRAYATHLGNTGYGNSEFFTTCPQVSNVSIIGTWQSISSPCSGYMAQSFLETTKLEITPDSTFTQYYRNQLIVSSVFSFRPYNQDFYSIVFKNSQYTFPYYYIKFHDCNTIELVNPFIDYQVDPCDYYRRIK